MADNNGRSEKLSENTPVEIPETVASLKSNPGREFKRPDTDRLSLDLIEATNNSGEMGNQELSKAVIELGNYLLSKNSNDGGGGKLPPPARKQTQIIALIIILLTGGGYVGNYYTTKALAEDNKEKIENHSKKPMHDTAGQEIQYIQVRVKGVEEKVDNVIEGQKKISNGVEQLKKEAQTVEKERLENEKERLENENERLRRELQRRNRDR